MNKEKIRRAEDRTCVSRDNKQLAFLVLLGGCWEMCACGNLFLVALHVHLPRRMSKYTARAFW